MQTKEIRVAVDIGSRQHRVALAGPEGRILEEFDLAHNPVGFQYGLRGQVFLFSYVE